jgi:hypothetical protein
LLAWFLVRQTPGELADFVLKPTNIETVASAFFYGSGAKISDGLGVIWPLFSNPTRQSQVGWRIVAKQRVPRQSPDVALRFSGWNALSKVRRAREPIPA